MINKRVELGDILSQHNYDILCLTEACTKNKHTILPFKNYQIFRHDILSKGERGTVILVNDNLKVKEFHCNLQKPSNIEIQSIIVQLNFQKSIIISCIYRHPQYSKKILHNDYEFINNWLEYLHRLPYNFILTGDFNLKDNYSTPIIDFAESHDIKQLVKVPTREKNILDLIFVKHAHSILHHNNIKTFISDHNLIDCTIACCKPHVPEITIHKRKFIVQHIPAFVKSVEQSFFYTIDDPIILLDTLSVLYDRYFPMIKISFKPKPKLKIISKKIKSMIRKEKKTYNKLKRWPCEKLRHKVKKLKKAIKLNILSESKHKIQAYIKDHNVWSGMKEFFPLKVKQKTPLNIHPDIINDHFIQISTKIDDDHGQPTKPAHINASNKTFYFKDIRVSDILSAWVKMKNQNSMCTDPLGLSNKMLSIALQSINFCKSLATMLNRCIVEGYVPDEWKISRITAIPKCSTPVHPTDTRPISIQPVLLKLLDKCMLSQISEYFNANNFITDNQFGFRKGYSTNHALISLGDFIYESLDKNEICIVVSLDFQKAFDTVDREILLEKMKWYGINCDIIKSLIMNRQQYVQINDNNTIKRSKVKVTTRGVVQGSATSAFYFSLYINDLPNVIKNCNTVIFADDSTIAIRGKLSEISNMISRLENDLNNISEWLVQNKIKLNIDKTKFIVFGKANNLKALPNFNVCINKQNLERVHEIKILGIIFDESLSFIPQMNKVSKSCYMELSKLFSIKNMLTSDQKLMLVNALVMSKLNYGSMVWLSSKNNNVYAKYNKIVRCASRLILNKRKYDPVASDICTNLGFYFADYRYRFEVLNFAYKCTYLMNTGIFKDYIDFSFKIAQTTRQKSFTAPVCSPLSKWGRNCLKFSAVNEWLKLPDYVCNSVHKYSYFKNALYNFLLETQYDESVKKDDPDDLIDFDISILF